MKLFEGSGEKNSKLRRQTFSCVLGRDGDRTLSWGLQEDQNSTIQF
jgi:hypothetical protein